MQINAALRTAVSKLFLQQVRNVKGTLIKCLITFPEDRRTAAVDLAHLLMGETAKRVKVATTILKQRDRYGLPLINEGRLFFSDKTEISLNFSNKSNGRDRESFPDIEDYKWDQAKMAEAMLEINEALRVREGNRLLCGMVLEGYSNPDHAVRRNALNIPYTHISCEEKIEEGAPLFRVYAHNELPPDSSLLLSAADFLEVARQIPPEKVEISPATINGGDRWR
jgi:hypothetical protein